MEYQRGRYLSFPRCIMGYASRPQSVCQRQETMSLCGSVISMQQVCGTNFEQEDNARTHHAKMVLPSQSLLPSSGSPISCGRTSPIAQRLYDTLWSPTHPLAHSKLCCRKRGRFSPTPQIFQDWCSWDKPKDTSSRKRILCTGMSNQMMIL